METSLKVVVLNEIMHMKHFALALGFLLSMNVTDMSVLPLCPGAPIGTRTAATESAKWRS